MKALGFLVTLLLPMSAWADDSNQAPADALNAWWKSYSGGGKQWEMFRDADIAPTRGQRRMSAVASAIQSWQAGDGASGGGMNRGRGRRGGGTSGTVEQRIARIRQAAEAETGHLRDKVLPYVETLELFQAAAADGSPEAMQALLAPASLDESWSPALLRRLEKHRPLLIQREAARALQRVPPSDLAPLLMNVAREEVGDGDRARACFELLSGLLEGQVRNRGILDSVASLSVAALTQNKRLTTRIAALVTLRTLSNKHEAFRLGDDERAALLAFVEKHATKGPDVLVITALKILGRHPHLESIERLAHLTTKGRSMEERVRDELWTALNAITPVTIRQDKGADAWLEWLEAERDTPRLASWIADHAGGGPMKNSDPAYASSRFYGIPVVGKSVVFVIDISGSMARPLGGTERKAKIEGAKEELIKALEALAPESKFTIVTFHDPVDTWSKKRVKASAGSVKKAVNFVSKLEPGANTNLHGGLVTGYGLTDTDRRAAVTGLKLPEQIILLSDGQPTAGEFISGAEILADIARIDPAALTRIDTIALGREADTRFLKALSDRHGGTMVEIR